MGNLALRIFNRNRTDPADEVTFTPGSEPFTETSVPTPCGQWSELLETLTAELHGLVESVETEFLAVGARLHDFHRCGGEVVRKSADVAEQVAGEKMTGTIRNLEEIFNHMCSYLAHTEQQTVKSIQTLETIYNLLGETAEPLAGFKKMNKVLRMFGASTKIESARVEQGAAGFETIADEVILLAERVHKNSRTIHSQKDELSGVIRQTLALVTAREVEQRSQVRMILDNTRQSLTALVDINSQCAAAAVSLSSFSEEVARNIGEVVVSMQFHDIVRQKVEHVNEALESLIAKFRERRDGQFPLDLIREAGNLGELLAAHLSHAREELLSAVGSVSGNLCEVARKELRMAYDTRKMAGIADRSGASFFEEMEHGLNDVRKALANTASSNRNLSVAMTTVAGTVEDITRFINDIDEICEEIELISLNAQIKSARIGKGGAALGVIAEAIQRLSVDTSLRTTPVSTILISINEAAASQCRQVQLDISLMETDVETMTNDLGGLLYSLCRVNENLLSSLSLMEGEVEALSNDIENVIAGISSHTKVAEVLGDCIETLGKIVSEARALVGDDTGADRAESLSVIAEHYTMDSERSVHASVIATETLMAVTDGENGGESQGGAADNFGDNVELF